MADLLRAPASSPAPICAVTMPSPVPRHFGPGNRLYADVYDGAAAPGLHVRLESRVCHELGSLGALGCALDLPLRNRGAIRQRPSSCRRVAAEFT